MKEYTLAAKTCMSHLLLKETFDRYLFIEGEATTFSTFTVDGFLHKDFFDEAPEEAYARWQDVRAFFRDIMKGTRTPLRFQIVLSMPASAYAAFLAQQGVTGISAGEVKGLYLNFHYDGETLTCVSGTSTQTFTLDKSLEETWDAYVGKILSEMIL